MKTKEKNMTYNELCKELGACCDELKEGEFFEVSSEYYKLLEEVSPNDLGHQIYGININENKEIDGFIITSKELDRDKKLKQLGI